MKPYNLTDFAANETWLILRLDTQVQTQPVDIYLTMDLPSGMLLATQTIETEVAQAHHCTQLLDDSAARKGAWPKRILLAQGDPAEGHLRTAAAKHGARLDCVPDYLLEDLTSPVKASFVQKFFSPSSVAYSPDMDDVDEMDKQAAKQMIPDTYDPCWCASGKKFKFCCKPIFREIVGAMSCAEEGRKDEALKYIAEAKKIAGETAEVLCREAIVWSFFDGSKSASFLASALTVNPNHPRSNYIHGIDLKQQGDHAGAIEAYLRAIANYPKSDRFHLNETYNNLGSAYHDAGDYAKAKDAWEQAVILMPSDKTARRNLMEFIYQNTRLSESERAASPFVKSFFKRLR